MGATKVGFDLKGRSIARGQVSLYEELLANQQLSPDEIAQLQSSRLAAIARFAMASTRFYREYYHDAGLRPADLLDPAVVEALPLIDRSIVKDNADGFWSAEANPRTVRDARTGGTTGEPLRTGVDQRVPTLALAWRMYSWWGIDPWDNLARAARWEMGRAAQVRNALKWWPSKQVYLDAGLMTPQEMRRFIRRWQAIRPKLLEGYVGALIELADFARRSGEVLPAPTAIGTTAAPLTDSARHYLEETFGAPVFDEYRCSEVQWMAGQCRVRNGLHVFADMRRIEVVGEDGAPVPTGDVGNLVVSDLTNRVFPIIRYRNGDRGSLLPDLCSCGVRLPLMAAPDGRQTDVIRLPDGTVIAGRLMAIFSEHPDAVKLFQIHQRRDYSIELRVVLGERADAWEQVARVADLIRDRVACSVPVTVLEVDSIPMPRGKSQYVVSDVAGPVPN